MDKSLKEKLSKLGPEKLAAFLEKEAAINPAFMETVERLVDHDSPNKVLESILDEIKHISRSHKFIDWRESSRFSQELARIIYSIETLLLPNHPQEALKALDAFLNISANVIERVDDSNGNIGDEFRYAVNVWGKTWNYFTDIDGSKLAKAIWKYFDKNDYSLFDDIVSSCEEALKRSGLNELEELIKSKCSDEKSRFCIFHALHDIALLRQSPEAFLEAFQLTKRDMSTSDQLELAKLYIDISRINEAIHLLESIKSDYEAYKRTNLLIDAYSKIGKKDVAQVLRWDGFIKQRRKDLFKTYYDNLSSDAEKQKALDAAIDTALSWDTIESISMLFEIQQHDKAADLLLKRYDTLQGHQYYTLKDFAEEFTKVGYPLHAILIYRRLSEDILARAQSKYYHHAITYLKKSKEISTYVTDWMNYPPTLSYFNQLKEEHRRKPSFMSKFEGL